jgi:hypothetical protein
MKSSEDIERDLKAIMALPTDEEQVDAIEAYLKSLSSDAEFVAVNQCAAKYLNRAIEAPFRTAIANIRAKRKGE